MARPAFAGEGWNLALLSEVSGSPDRLVLKDIVDSARTSPELINQYGEISMPQTGGDGSIQPSHVLLAFSRAGADLSKIRLLTYSEVRMKRADQNETLNLVRNAILENVKGLYQGDSSQIQVELTRIPANLPDRKLFTSIEAQIQEEGATVPEKSFLIKFIGADKATVATAEFKGKLSLKTSVVAARRPIMKGEFVSKEDFEEVNRELTGQEKVVRSLSELGEGRWQVATAIEKGAPLSKESLSFASSIQKGAVVTLLTGDDRFQVRTVGRVLEVMDNGANVLVENVDSKKTLLGKPLNGSEVRVGY